MSWTRESARASSKLAYPTTPQAETASARTAGGAGDDPVKVQCFLTPDQGTVERPACQAIPHDDRFDHEPTSPRAWLRRDRHIGDSPSKCSRAQYKASRPRLESSILIALSREVLILA